MIQNVPDSKPNRLRPLIWLCACMLLAFAIRSHGLGAQSLWWDESLSLYRSQETLAGNLANHITLTDGQTEVVTVDNHPPLYFLLLSATTRLLGDSEFALRVPSLFFSVLLAPLVFAIGKRLVGERAALLAALLTALSPMLLWYGQEARMYTMAPFLALLSTYALLRVLDRHAPHGWLWAAVYVVATVAMLLTHYLTLLLLPVQVLVSLVIIARGSTLHRWLWPGLAVGAAATAVLIYGLSIMPPPAPQGGFNFVPFSILARDVLNSFSLGLSVDVTEVLYLDLLFLAVALLGMVASQPAGATPRLPAGLILTLYLTVPLALTYFAGYVRPFYMNSRHLIFTLPAFYLVLGAGLAAMRTSRLLTLAALAAMVAGMLFSIQQYNTNEAYNKDDHQAWGEYLRTHVQPGDLVVVDPPHIAELYRYYADSGAPWVGLPPLDMPATPTTGDILERLSVQYRNIWLAFSHTPPWGDPDRAPEKWLERHLTKTDERSFHSYASLVRVQRYATRPLGQVTQLTIQAPAQANLEDRMDFLGHDVIAAGTEPGRALALTLYWRRGQRMDGDYKISLRLVDDSGRIWAQADHQPANGFFPTARWRNGETVRDDADIVIPLATPPGSYSLEMVVYNATSNRTLSVLSSDGRPGSQAIQLGRFSVLRPTRQPAVSALPISLPGGSAAGPLSLLGLHITTGSLRQGESATVEAFWRVDKAWPSEYLARVSLLDAAGKLWSEQVFPVAGPDYGMTGARRGDIVRGLYGVSVPRDAPGGEYAVRILLEDAVAQKLLPLKPTGWRALLPRHTGQAMLRVVEREHLFAVPALQHTVDAVLGGKVKVLGYSLASEQERPFLRPGDAITITVAFQALATMDADYSIFLHLVNNEQEMRGQTDITPHNGVHPTSVWLPGEVVTETLTVILQPGTPPGRLTAILGFYTPSNGARLPVSGAGQRGDFVSLFTLDAVR